MPQLCRGIEVDVSGTQLMKKHDMSSASLVKLDEEVPWEGGRAGCTLCCAYTGPMPYWSSNFFSLFLSFFSSLFRLPTGLRVRDALSLWFGLQLLWVFFAVTSNSVWSRAVTTVSSRKQNAVRVVSAYNLWRCKPVTCPPSPQLILLSVKCVTVEPAPSIHPPCLISISKHSMYWRTRANPSQEWTAWDLKRIAMFPSYQTDWIKTEEVGLSRRQAHGPSVTNVVIEIKNNPVHIYMALSLS